MTIVCFLGNIGIEDHLSVKIASICLSDNHCMIFDIIFTDKGGADVFFWTGHLTVQKNIRTPLPQAMEVRCSSFCIDRISDAAVELLIVWRSAVFVCSKYRLVFIRVVEDVLVLLQCGALLYETILFQT